MKEQTSRVLYRGHRRQLDDVVAKLNEEIRLYEGRLQILGRVTLPGSEYLCNTYRAMIDTRIKIRDDLLRIR